MIPYLIALISVHAMANFDWQAHRGGRGLYPENTINAMKHSQQYPITTLELDVVVSNDQQVVVSHEPWMNEEMCLTPKGESISGREVNLYKLDYAEIKKYDCGSKPHPRFPRQLKIKEHKPLLKDLIAELDLSGKYFNIEIKSTPEDEAAGFQPEYKKFTDLVLSVLQALPTSRYSIQSFDWRVLKYLHSKHPEVTLVALIESRFEPREVIKVLGFRPAIFSPYYEFLSREDVEYFHREKIKVIPWTVNTPEAMKKVIGMKVDGIITDYPDLISTIPSVAWTITPTCKAQETLFEGKCARLPKHAVPSQQSPGWDCEKGYVQKRLSCVKVNLPKHAILNNDGKTWSCKNGFKRYRSTCKKN